MLAALELFEFTSRRREQWYGGKLVPARHESPWVVPDETGMYSNVVFDLDPKKYDA